MKNMVYRFGQILNNNRFLAVFVFILFLGLFVHSVLNCVLNHTLSLQGVLPGSAEGTSLQNLRLFLFRLGDAAVSVCSFIFFLGSVLRIYTLVQKKMVLSVRRLLLLFTGTIAAIGLCPIGFALFDGDWGEYLFPIWSILFECGVLFLALMVVNTINYLRVKKS